MEKYRLYDDNLHLFAQMIRDIESAKEYVYLETYRFGNDSMGAKFRNALTKKAKQGVEVKILMDGYGSDADESFFKELKSHGGEIKVFRKIVFNPAMLKKNNFRDHRKLIIIDDRTSYIGSSNITQHSLSWRESNLRMEHAISKKFKSIFMQNWEISDKFYFRKRKHVSPLHFGEFEIIRDVPSFRFRRVRKKRLSLIRSAKKRIYIETPYFLPGFRIREALTKAAGRGIDVRLIMPVASDVRIADIVRQKYFGKLHHGGVRIFFYRPEFIHSKAMLVDDQVFGIGSSNLDHRSATLQFEINLYGKNKSIVKKVDAHFKKTLLGCEEFDFDSWQNRSLFIRFMERLLSIIEYWL
jgi:cardiolipin synthase